MIRIHSGEKGALHVYLSPDLYSSYNITPTFPASCKTIVLLFGTFLSLFHHPAASTMHIDFLIRQYQPKSSVYHAHPSPYPTIPTKIQQSALDHQQVSSILYYNVETTTVQPRYPSNTIYPTSTTTPTQPPPPPRPSQPFPTHLQRPSQHLASRFKTQTPLTPSPAASRSVSCALRSVVAMGCGAVGWLGGHGGEAMAGSSRRQCLWIFF